MANARDDTTASAPDLVVRTYESAHAILADHRSFSSASASAGQPPGFLVNLDPPEHTRYRQALVPLLSRSRVEALRPEVEALVEVALDRLIADGAPADLIPHIVDPVPYAVVSELLGIPEEAREVVRQLARRMTDFSFEDHDAAEAHRVLVSYFETLVGSVGVDKLLGGLQTAGDLTVEEAAGVGVMVLNAGFETTSGTLGLGLFELLKDPNQTRNLALAVGRGDDAAVRRAVEEMLRYCSPLQYGIPRTGPDGNQQIYVSLDSVNRDPARFTEPERFDVQAQRLSHLAFGQGVHRCVGAGLARLQLDVILRGLLQRLPSVTLACTEKDSESAQETLLRGLSRLLVRW